MDAHHIIPAWPTDGLQSLAGSLANPEYSQLFFSLVFIIGIGGSAGTFPESGHRKIGI